MVRLRVIGVREPAVLRVKEGPWHFRCAHSLNTRAWCRWRMLKHADALDGLYLEQNVFRFLWALQAR